MILSIVTVVRGDIIRLYTIINLYLFELYQKNLNLFALEEGQTMNNNIHVTEHAIIRYTERKKKMKRDSVIFKIKEGVKRSRIIAIDEMGKETREYKGLLYVCKMENHMLTVITVLFSEVAHRFAC